MTLEAPASHPSLLAALCAAMSDITRVDKAGWNNSGGFAYRAVDDVVAAARGPLLSHGIVPHVTFGPVRPIEPEHDGGAYVGIDVTLTLHHVGTGESLSSTIEGRGRQQSKNGAVHDPRTIGAAVSYAVKTLLINWLMLAGGDDTVDEAPKEEAPSRQQRPDPVDDSLRNDVLDSIAALTADAKSVLRDWCRDQGIVVRSATTSQLKAIAAKLDTMAATPEHPVADPDDGDIEVEPPVELLPMIDGPAEPVAAAEPERVAPVLVVVSDNDGCPADRLSDEQWAFVVGSGGLAESPDGVTDREQTKAALRWATALRTKRGVRQGFLLVSPQTGDVIVDGTDALTRYLA